MTSRWKPPAWPPGPLPPQRPPTAAAWGVHRLRAGRHGHGAATALRRGRCGRGGHDHDAGRRSGGAVARRAGRPHAAAVPQDQPPPQTSNVDAERADGGAVDLSLAPRRATPPPRRRAAPSPPRAPRCRRLETQPPPQPPSPCSPARRRAPLTPSGGRAMPPPRRRGASPGPTRHAQHCCHPALSRSNAALASTVTTPLPPAPSHPGSYHEPYPPRHRQPSVSPPPSLPPP